MDNDLIKTIRKSLIGQKNIFLLDEAAKVTGFSKECLLRLIRSNTIPHHKLEGQVYFLQHELNQWIKEMFDKF